MSGTGPQRIEVPASATPEEAAALVAVVEQFLRDTAVAVDSGPSESRWSQVARREALAHAAAWDADADAPGR
ncbi:MAG: hypothetical protein AB7G37_04230 [Solirubrobacteraceae bacterium]